MSASLILKTGETFNGISFGADKPISGEVVFQTGMVGYPESLTDPSYRGQILVLTYPLIGNYGISPKKLDEHAIPYFFESDNIHISALIVGEYTNDQNHWNCNKSLSKWLKENDIPAISGIDTRRLTKIIREHGTILGRIIIHDNENEIIDTDTNTDTSTLEFYDPNQHNLVKQVSCNEVIEYNHFVKGNQKILVIDCGIKYNQIRMLLKRNVKIIQVPYNYDFFNSDKVNLDEITGVFVSNGPGDPRMCHETITNLEKLMNEYPDMPMFGICLGHQLLSLAAGANITKLKYGNRGHNISCQLLKTQQCNITSQNHGFAVTDIPDNWEALYTNANDNSNEGIYHKTRPYFSVQFHPEANAGPRDTEFLFDIFLNKSIHEFVEKMKSEKEKIAVNKPNKVLILGSGALSIGQAGEFDYSGSQAIKAYKEENIFTILINPNIATVQTSNNFVDKVYFLPVTPDFVKRVIEIEHPDSVSISFGGQTALNCAVELYQQNIFKKNNIEILGTPIEAIIDTEDRQRFKYRLDQVNEHCAPSISISDGSEAIYAANKIGYPVLVRAAYALGGMGSGFAKNDEELMLLVNKAFSYSNQVIIDKSLRGWKEIEYEIVRDRYDNTISVCNMENFDPLGVHTGESIVIAPSQTLTDEEYNMLRTAAIKMIKHLGIVGECNIQYALNPDSLEYFIIEINARLSRSSALASKATGYPLAYIAAKLGLGYSLLELKNSITKTTTTCFEPSLDYCVVKIPKWDLKKFPLVNKKIGSSMKSVGEAMAISRNFEEALQKALRMTNNVDGFEPYVVKDVTDDDLINPGYDRIFSLATVLYDERYSEEELYLMTRIDRWFLRKLKRIIDVRRELESWNLKQDLELSKKLMLKAKKLGFSDYQISKCVGSTEIVVRKKREQLNMYPCIKQIDTVAGEFPCFTNYLYMTYHGEENDIDDNNNTNEKNNKKSIMVLGSGVYRIGSSVEFDWCTVNCINRIRELGYESIMVNCNPETVSTDYDEADKLFFDELSFETVMDIYQLTKSDGIILSMGGQIPNNIAMPLYRQNVNVIGTSPEMIDQAENRYKFSRMLDHIGVNQPKWKELSSIEEAKKFCRNVKYPCLVRPSYVLSGAAMNVAYSDKDLVEYLSDAKDVSKDHPVVISKFISNAKEIEVDAVAKNGRVKLIAISEHVENAGVHSGDATLILPSQDLTEDTKNKIKKSVYKIADKLLINGPFNIQFMAKDDEIKVIECNLRVSRSFPFVSKTLNINFAEYATDIMLDQTPKTYKNNNLNNCQRIGVKVPKFSFDRLSGADMVLGVEMMSTGEVACFGENHYEAYLKGLLSTGFRLPNPKSKIFISIGSYKYKREFLPSMKILQTLGYELYASQGTADFYQEYDISIKTIVHDQIDLETLSKYYQNNKFSLIINVSMPNKGKLSKKVLTYGYLTRRIAIDFNIPLITDIKCAKLLIKSLEQYPTTNKLPIKSHIDAQTSYRTIKLPGLIDVHVHVREPGNTDKEDWSTCSKAAISGGITTIFAMPNTNPAVIDEASFDLTNSLAERKSYCNYGLFFGASQNNTETVSNICQDKGGVALKMYLNSTYGPLVMQDMGIWREHIKNWNHHQPICVHAERQTLAAIIHLANIYGKRLHVCHVARKEEIDIIRESKKAGMNLTCEVAPHHLFMTNTSTKLTKNMKEVRPCLVKQRDQDALWENMEWIDCFATDHAPHLSFHKQDKCCPGFPGLETALPLLLTAVNDGRLTIKDIITKYHDNPIKIFNLKEEDISKTYIEIDLDKEWTVGDQPKFSKCDWTPFAGFKVKGKVNRVVLNNKTIFVDDKFLVNKPTGQYISYDLENITSKHIQSEFISKSKIVSNVNRDGNRDDNDNVHLFLSGDIDLESSDSSQNDMVSNSKLNSKYNSIVTVDNIDKEMLRTLFRTASEMKRRVQLQDPTLKTILNNKIISSIFYEPSTRTSSSFNVAVKKLGGELLEIKADQSSVKKGESIEDFMRTVECYTDLVILRSKTQNDIFKAKSVMKKPLINAGNGDGEHPTQALLDIYTIREERGTVNGLTITFYGDLLYSRTVHSLVKLLSLYNVRINYVSHKDFKIPSKLYQDLEMKNIEQNEYDLSEINDILSKTDILYMTRIQRERFKELDGLNENIKYKLTPDMLTCCKSDLVIMHPLPRVDEISKDVDDDPRAAYFRQMENGLYIRMALLNHML